MEQKLLWTIPVIAHITAGLLNSMDFFIGNQASIINLSISIVYIMCWIGYILAVKRNNSGTCVIGLVFWCAEFILSVMMLFAHMGMIDSDVIMLLAILGITPLYGFYFFSESFVVMDLIIIVIAVLLSIASLFKKRV